MSDIRMGKTKRCTICGIEKPLEEFNRNKRTIDGRLNQCRKCCGEVYKAWRVKNAQINVSCRISGSRKCVRCGVEKPASEFSRNKGRPGGLNCYCRTCMNDYDSRKRKIVVQTKVCPHCNVEKSVSEFAINRSKSGGLASWCKDCVNAKWKGTVANTQQLPTKTVNVMVENIPIIVQNQEHTETKICSKCGVEKPLWSFRDNMFSLDGKMAVCIRCVIAGHQEQRYNKSICTPGHKLCSRCSTVKPIEAFYKDKSSKDGHANYCADCFRAYMNRRNMVRAEEQGQLRLSLPKVVKPPKQKNLRKVCSKCGREKAFGRFNNHKASKDGKSGWCKVCNRDYLRKYYKDKGRLYPITGKAESIATKRCPKCGIEKRLGRFYDNCGSADGKHAYCKSCMRKVGRERYKRKQEELRKIREGTIQTLPAIMSKKDLEHALWTMPLRKVMESYKISFEQLVEMCKEFEVNPPYCVKRDAE